VAASGLGLDRFRFPFALLLLLASTLAPAALGASRDAEAEYRLATGVASTVDASCEERAPAVNGVCFQLYPFEKHVGLAIRDASQRNVAAQYAFHDGDVVLAAGAFCHSDVLLPVPAGARTLVLLLGEPGKLDDAPPPGCQLQRGVGGVVSAAFR
jgi:hypothetical protein